MFGFWKKESVVHQQKWDHSNATTIHSVTEVDKTTYGRWSLRKWIVTPKDIAGRVIGKPFTAYRVWRKKDEDPSNSVFTAVKLLKKCSDTFPFTYLVQQNFSDKAVLILRGGFTIVLAATPPAIRESLYLDSFVEFNSNYVVPFLTFTEEWLRDNGSDIAACSKEALPALQVCGKQVVVVSSVLWSKSQHILAFVYSEVQKILSDRKVKEILWNAAIDLQKNIRYTVETLYGNIPPEYVEFLVENRWILVNHLFNLLKQLLGIIVCFIPVAITCVQNASSSSYKMYMTITKTIASFLDNNPALRRGIKDVCGKIMTLFKSGTITAVELTPMMCTIIKDCVYQALKICKIMLPYIQDFLDANGIVLKEVARQTAQIIISLVTSIIRKTFNQDIQAVVEDKLPLVISLTSNTFKCTKVLVQHSFYSSRFICCKFYEYEPVLRNIAIRYGHVLVEITLGILSALNEISPSVYASIMDTFPIVTRGLTTVGTDLQCALSVISPVIASALQEILRTSAAAYFEIYPDLIGLTAIYSDLLVASSVVAPVALRATTEIFECIIHALCVILPAMQKSVCLVVPAVMTAARISTPVILSASCNLSSTLKFASVEMCRDLQSACAEVLSTSFKGASVINKDFVDASYAVSANRKLLLKKPLAVFDGLKIISSTVNEFSSLLWIVYYLDVTEDGICLSSKQHPLSSFHSREIVYSICRNGGYILAFSFGTVLLCNISILKGNSYAISAACELQVKLSQYYERVEPKFLESMIKIRMYLKTASSLRSEEDREMIGKVWLWYILDRLAECVQQNVVSPKHLTRTICLTFFSVLAKLSKTYWHACIRTCPLIWSFLKTVSPKVWTAVCDVSPRLWSSFCKMNRNAWTRLKEISPKLWRIYCKMSVATWKLLLILIPEIWEPIKLISPEIWSLICQVFDLLWIRVNEVSPATWDAICVYVPIFWNCFCNISSSVWLQYTYLISKIWKVLCLSVEYNWKMNRYITVKTWKTLMVEDSSFNELLSNLNLIVQSVLNLNNDMWFLFCSVVIIFVMIRQYNPVTKMFVVPKCKQVDSNPENFLKLNSRMNESTANLAFQAVQTEMSTIKAILASAKYKMHYFFSIIPKITSHSQVASSCKSASERVVSYGVQRANVTSLIMKNVITSIRQSSDYLSIKSLPFCQW